MPGDRVQLTDSKGRLHTITLEAGREFHTHQGRLLHDSLIGSPEGSVVLNTAGVEYLAAPLLADYVMSMPRGAAVVVYPKDAGQIVTMGDIHPGARVVEAGVGSGALSMSLLRAIGERGELISSSAGKTSRRSPRATSGPSSGPTTRPGASSSAISQTPSVTRSRTAASTGSSWTCSPRGNASPQSRPHSALRGVLTCYVATTTQLSRIAEALREHGGFTEPSAWESLVRGWHCEGLAGAPPAPHARAHRFPCHLTPTRDGGGSPSTDPSSGEGCLRGKRRWAGHDGRVGRVGHVGHGGEHRRHTRRSCERGALAVPDTAWTPEALGERTISDKKVRRARRSVTPS